jgi:hypothetical protein
MTRRMLARSQETKRRGLWKMMTALPRWTTMKGGRQAQTKMLRSARKTEDDKTDDELGMLEIEEGTIRKDDEADDDGLPEDEETGFDTEEEAEDERTELDAEDESEDEMEAGDEDGRDGRQREASQRPTA